MVHKRQIPKESRVVLELLQARKQLRQSEIAASLDLSSVALETALTDLARRGEIERRVVGSGQGSDYAWGIPMHAKSMND